MERFDPSDGYRYSNVVANPEKETHVILSFSGGGTRAAAFSFGVLEKLRCTPIEGTTGRSLLDEVDVISSVSGGSFTAAYYALHGEEAFLDFERRFLTRDVQSDLFWALASPWNWLRLASGDFDRIDLAAEYYDEQIFDGHTFRDLLDRSDDRPFIIINATDMTRGSRFEFTQDQFDLLSSSLASFPVGRAVAASSAFPGLLSPVRLINHGQIDGYRRPEWIGSALLGREVAPHRYRRAQNSMSYLEPESSGDGRARKSRPFIHLLDGGIADNIGLRGPLAAVTSVDGPWSLLTDINNGHVKRVVVIAVDAKTEPQPGWSQHKSAPGILSVLQAVASHPMDNYSMETVTLLQRVFGELRAGARSERDCEKFIQENFDPDFKFEASLTPVEFSFIHVSFDDVPNEQDRRDLKSMRTTFRLSEEDVSLLRKSAAAALDADSAFQAALAAIRSDN